MIVFQCQFSVQTFNVILHIESSRIQHIGWTNVKSGKTVDNPHWDEMDEAWVDLQLLSK